MGRVTVSHEELEDLRAALEGLHVGRAYSARVLYTRHVDAMERLGHKVVHPVRFGQILAEYGALRKQVWDKHWKRAGGRKGSMVAGWII